MRITSTGRNDLVGADPQTFSSLELTGYGKDALHVYYTDHVVDAADAATFSTIAHKGSYYCGLGSCGVDAEDKYHRYFRGALVN